MIPRSFLALAVVLLLLPPYSVYAATLNDEDKPNHQIFLNHSACHERSGKDSLLFLGQNVSSLDACLLLAVQRPCQSACWSKTAPFQCHCHTAPIWMPLANTTVDSAVLGKSCTSPKDCSYNGACHFHAGTGLSTCTCHTGWGGVRCGELQLLPVHKSAMGFREINNHNNENVSTWGAPILWDNVTQQWHGWASEIINDCGIHSWNVNSRIVHIVSNNPTGPFRKVEVFAAPFAHEPSVKRGPQGEWVMLYSAYNNITQHSSASQKGYDPTNNPNEWNQVVCTNCSQGACLSPVGSKGCPFQRGKPQELNHPYIQMMAIAPTPYGPWKHTEIPALSTAWDWNTALTINQDGSAVALIRGGMVWHADQYANPSSWHPVNGGGGPTQQSPQWSIPVEDPYIWRDAHGVYHALAHCFSPFYGVHAYVDPAQVPTDYHTEFMNWTVTGVAYGNGVEFTDRTSYSFVRRERPQLIFDKDNGVTPIALSNGVAYGKDPYATGQDMTFTLVQAIRQAITIGGDETVDS